MSGEGVASPELVQKCRTFLGTKLQRGESETVFDVFLNVASAAAEIARTSIEPEDREKALGYEKRVQAMYRALIKVAAQDTELSKVLSTPTVQDISLIPEIKGTMEFIIKDMEPFVAEMSETPEGATQQKVLATMRRLLKISQDVFRIKGSMMEV